MAEHPELDEFTKFGAVFERESDRGAALVAAAMLDDRLKAMLAAFLIESSEAEQLLAGFNAPLGTFSARATAAMALGLLERHEFDEISLIRKIRNEFGHAWETIPFESGKVADLVGRLPWLGPPEFEQSATKRSRFNVAVAILLVDLMWRVRLIKAERRVERTWPNKTR